MQPYHKQLVELTHLLLCQESHYQGTPEGLKDRNANLCYFLQEETLTDAPSQPDHLIWQERAEKLCRDLGNVIPEIAHKKLLELLQLIRKINDLAPENSERIWQLVFELV